MLSHPRPAYHGEIGREATAHQYGGLGFRKPTIGGSGREATAGNRLSGRGFLVTPLKPRRPGHSALSRKARHGCDLEATAPNVCMRNGKSPLGRRRECYSFCKLLAQAFGLQHFGNGCQKMRRPPANCPNLVAIGASGCCTGGQPRNA